MAGLEVLRRFNLGLSRWTEVHWEWSYTSLLDICDGSVLRLELFNVLAQRFHQSLCMLWGQDDSRLHTSLWCAWHHTDEIYDELSRGMGNHGQVGILPLRDLLAQLNVDLSLLWFFVVSHVALCLD